MPMFLEVGEIWESAQVGIITDQLPICTEGQSGCNKVQGLSVPIVCDGTERVPIIRV